MRLAISRRIVRALNFSASWDWAQVCGSNRGHSAGRWSLPSDEALVISICVVVAIPVVAIGAVVVCGEERRGVTRGGRGTKSTVSLEPCAAAGGSFHQKLSNGQTLGLVVVRDSSIAIPMRSM